MAVFGFLTLLKLKASTRAARQGDSKALRVLLEAASNPDSKLHKFAQEVLGSLKITVVPSLLLLAARERDNRIRNDACVAAGMACARVTIPGGYLFSKNVVGEGAILKTFASRFVREPWAGSVITKLCNNPAIPVRMLQNWLASVHATVEAAIEEASLDTLHAVLNLKEMSSGGPIRNVLSLNGIRKLAKDELARRESLAPSTTVNPTEQQTGRRDDFSTPEKTLETFFVACARKDWEAICGCEASTRPAGMRFRDAPREMAEDLSRTFGDGRVMGRCTIDRNEARVPIGATFPATTAELVLENGEWKIQDFSS